MKNRTCIPPPCWPPLCLALLCSISFFNNQNIGCAETIYVCPDLSCDIPPDAGAPKIYAAIQSAIEVANPGDTIVVRPGTYNEILETRKSGLAGSPITLVADSGAILEGSDQLWIAVSVMHDFWHIEGFEIQNFTGTAVDSQNWVDGIESLELVRLKIHDIGIGTLNDNGHGHGIYLIGPRNSLIEGCEVYNTDYNGIQFGGASNLTIRDTEVYRTNRVGIVGDCTGTLLFEGCSLHENNYNTGGIHADGIQLLGFENVIVRDCVAFDNIQDFFFEPYSEPASLGTNPGGSILVENCLFFQTLDLTGLAQYAQAIVLDHGYNTIASLRVKSCTFVSKNMGAGGVYNGDRYPNNPHFYLGSAEITDCIFYQSINGISADLIAGPLQTSGNVYWNFARDWYLPGFLRLDEYRAQNPGLETNSIESDPLFLDPKNFDFRLKADSLAVGKGYPYSDNPGSGPPAGPTPTPPPMGTPTPTPQPTPTPDASPTPEETPTPQPTSGWDWPWWWP